MRLSAHLVLALAVLAGAHASANVAPEPVHADLPPLAPAPPAVDADGWPSRLHALLQVADATLEGELGVSVVDPASGRSMSYRGDQDWYLASGIKVPVAIAVLRAVERGELALSSTLRLQAGDLVDGAGPTKRKPPGTALRVDWLLEQMLVHSDNTASDVLIRRIGIERVNAVADELMAQRCGPITSLADVRRHAYGALHPDAMQLASADLLALKRAPYGRSRYRELARILGVDPGQLLLDDIGSAFDSYYASRLNAAPLDAYAQLLVALLQGRALGPQSTDWLLATMGRAQTGGRRIVAGLPEGVRFAHKTGTQLRRQCDFGIVAVEDGGDARALVVAACNRGASLAAGEEALRAVGAALSASGALHATPAPASVHASAAPAPASTPVTAPR